MWGWKETLEAIALAALLSGFFVVSQMIEMAL